MTRLSKEDWSPFWRKPTITSFGNLFPANYDGPILEFWRRQLADCHGRVLDLACGNGALTWLANDIINAGEQRAQITGVDFADIDPFAVLGRRKNQFPSVAFVGDTPIEVLPFESGSVAVAISQYGIEYSDLGRSLPEVARVLESRGRMAFILHNEESVIIHGATEHLADFKRALNEIRVHDHALEVDRLQLTLGSRKKLESSPEYAAASGRLAEALAEVRAMLSRHPPTSPVHLYLSRLNEAMSNRPRKKGPSRRQQVIHARNALSAHIERVNDLAEAALSISELRDLAAAITGLGFTVVECESLAYGNNRNIGTKLVAVRGAGDAA